MANSTKKQVTSNPLTIAGIVGVGTLSVTALAVALTQPVTGEAVGAAPASEEVEMSTSEDTGNMASDEPVVQTSGTNVTPDDVADDTVPAVSADTTAEGMGTAEPEAELVSEPSDGEEPALPGAGDDDSPVGDAAPVNEAAASEDTSDDSSEITAEDDSAANMAADDSAENTASDEAPTVDEDLGETSTDLDTSEVTDNDDGEGNEPDGGAAPFNPTPSGPEGRDGDPLTTE